LVIGTRHPNPATLLDRSSLATLSNRAGKIRDGGDCFAIDATTTMVLESFLASRSETSARSESSQHVGFARDAGKAYNEGAFRHFLVVERTRAERSERSFLLLW
jgi:hypothetical protein